MNIFHVIDNYIYYSVVTTNLGIKLGHSEIILNNKKLNIFRQ